MDVRIVVANMHVYTIVNYQDCTHFGHSINIFNKLYSTKTNFIRYVDMFVEGELPWLHTQATAGKLLILILTWKILWEQYGMLLSENLN